jgi:hypothetical protein
MLGAVIIVVFLFAWTIGMLGEKPFGDLRFKRPKFLGGDDSDSESDFEYEPEDEPEPEEPQCRDGYERKDNTCSRMVSVPMPRQESNLIACPVGFNPDEDNVSMCNADSGLSQLLFTAQSKRVDGDEANIDSWVSSQKVESDVPLTCLTKQLPNEKYMAGCTREYKSSGYEPHLENIHKDPSESQLNNELNYQVVYKKATTAPKMTTCAPNSLVVDGACYNKACTEDSLLKMTQAGPMCVSMDSYNL